MVPLISLIAPGILRRRLNTADLLADLAGRFRGLFGESFYFGRNHRKTPTSFASAGSLDGRVSASKLVCPAMVLISSTTSPMRAAALDNSPTRSLVLRAWSTASLAMRANSCT